MKNTVILLIFVGIISSCTKEEDTNSKKEPDKNTIKFNETLNYGTMTDQEGNIYKTIKIGGQTWMAENLKTSKFRNGDPIPNEADQDLWYALTTGAYCNYNNDINISATYGKLYNWYAVNDSRNIAPEGWHVPTASEWTELSDFLGHNTVAGGKLKESDTIHWSKQGPLSRLIPATNESGFTGLPGGIRSNIECRGIRDLGSFWIFGYTSSNGNLGYRVLEVDKHYFDSKQALKYLGISVRCIKD